ncbi:short-chain dehydrogenase [Brevibacillus parabrevis]|uniref:SDR family oxidoreductase n=1 Tax=Brevibacillus parabrevis TaxID=54914 RepID=UPI0007AB7C57|nr:SDR family oxidoreductase [Brevibacillus parabrevis]KZE44612.1 short-chain dehydrogenase [Brevibacillus parabrevis]
MKKRPIALITGSSSGFGMHASVALVKAGFYVIASMRDPQKRGPLDKLANLHIATEHMEVISLDVTNPVQIEQAIADIMDRHGRIDLLLNNAGCAYGGFAEEVSPEQWRSQFAVNVFGLIDATRAVLPCMREQNAGRIINVSSISGRFGFPGLAPYVASKHAVEGFSESLRLELLPFHIHVSLIEPGSYRTAIWEKALQHQQSVTSSAYSGQMKQLRKQVESLMLSAPEPDEVIRAIVRAATTAKPRFRYPVGRGIALMIAAKTLLPWSWIERIVTKKLTPSKND